MIRIIKFYIWQILFNLKSSMPWVWLSWGDMPSSQAMKDYEIDFTVNNKIH